MGAPKAHTGEEHCKQKVKETLAIKEVVMQKGQAVTSNQDNGMNISKLRLDVDKH